jgi:hypothetical protein
MGQKLEEGTAKGKIPSTDGTLGKPRRWERLKDLTIQFPKSSTSEQLANSPTRASGNLPPILEQLPESISASMSSDYPRLLTILRDRGLAFRPTFNQLEAAEVIGISDRVLRDWTQADEVPCSLYPSGRPYYTAKNLEDFFTACARRRRRKAAK